MRIGRLSRSEQGISLLSTVLSLFLLVVAFTLTTTALLAALRAARMSYEQTLASQFLEAEMERLRTEPFLHLENGTRILETVRLTELPGARAEIQIEDYSLPGVKRLTVQIHWRSRTGPHRSARLVTLRSQ